MGHKFSHFLFQYFLCVLVIFALEIAAGVIGYIYYNEVSVVLVVAWENCFLQMQNTKAQISCGTTNSDQHL